MFNRRSLLWTPETIWNYFSIMQDLKFSQLFCWRFKSSRVLCSSVVSAVPDVSKYLSAFFFSVKLSVSTFIGSLYPKEGYRILRKVNNYTVLMTNAKHNSYNKFLFHSFLSALYFSNESSRSSPGARHNILYYTVWYCRYNRAGESSCFEVVGKSVE